MATSAVHASLVVGLIATLGCEGNLLNLGDANPTPATTPAPDTPWPGSSSAASGSDTPNGQGPQRPMMVLQISFDVLRARVPQGFFSQSEKVWNHLNEAAIQPQTAVLLQRNGLRVAVGDANSWPPIRALLEQEGQIETSQSRMVLNNGLPLVIEPDPGSKDQTVFMFRPDGSLGGASFPQSVNGLKIEYQLAGADVGTLRILVMPQIRLPRQPPRINAESPGFIDQPMMPPTRVLREMAFSAEIGPDQFIAVGPSRLVENAYLVGALLLREEKDGRPLESMYFITPKVMNSGQRPGF